ncbi:MAG: hypothetical protein AAFU73_05480 [Planctomycetota bacterium]
MDDRAADPWRPTRAELLERAAVLIEAAGELALAELVSEWGGLPVDARVELSERARQLGDVEALREELGDAGVCLADDELDLEDVDRGGAL